MKPKRRVLAPVHANIGVELQYRKRLDALIDAMHASLVRWLSAQWRNNPPELAMDDSPAMGLRDRMRKLGRQWRSRFDDAAPELAKYFATTALKRADGALAKILDDAGFTVQFRTTRAVNDVLQATLGENVGLIKSIAAQHLQAVEGHVMRSVTQGRDLATLTKALQEQFGVTKRRAAFIARSQNNLATASVTRARQIELGLTEAVWMHSGGGKHPRESHVKAGRDKMRYDVTKGALIDGEYILPGQLPNCRCVSRPVVMGF